MSPLSPRQAAIVELLAEGWTHKEVAAQLGLATTTVSSYLAVVRHKLEARTTLQAVVRHVTSGPRHLVALPTPTTGPTICGMGDGLADTRVRTCHDARRAVTGLSHGRSRAIARGTPHRDGG